MTSLAVERNVSFLILEEPVQCAMSSSAFLLFWWSSAIPTEHLLLSRMLTIYLWKQCFVDSPFLMKKKKKKRRGTKLKQSWKTPTPNTNTSWKTVRSWSRSLTGRAEEVMTGEMQRVSCCWGPGGDEGCPCGAEVHHFLQQNRQEVKFLCVKNDLQYSCLCCMCLMLHEEW